jgi:hypothetical protein
MRDIPGFEGMYAATENGRIWSNYTKKFLKPGYRNGYQAVLLGYKRYSVHRLVAASYLNLDLSDKSIQIDHINGIKDDNRVENLRLVTQYENHRAYHGKLEFMSSDTETHKCCSKCFKLKPRIEFSRRSKSKDGLRAICKECKHTNDSKGS